MRSVVCIFRLSPAELERIRELAAEAGLADNVGLFIRRKLFPILGIPLAAAVRPPGRPYPEANGKKTAAARKRRRRAPRK